MDWKEIDRFVNWHRDVLREAFKASEILAGEVRRQQELVSSFGDQLSRSLIEAEHRVALLPDLSAAVGDVHRVVEAYQAAIALPEDALLSAAREEINKAMGLVTHAPWQQMAEALISATASAETLRAFELTFPGQLLGMAGRFESAETPEEAEDVVGQLATIIVVMVQRAPAPARAALWNLLVGIVYPLLLYLAAHASARQDFERVHARLNAVQEQIREEFSDHSGALPPGADAQSFDFLTAEEVEVYVEPNAESEQVVSLPRNVAVRKVNESGEWLRVEFFVYPLSAPTTGWVRADGLRKVVE